MHCRTKQTKDNSAKDKSGGVDVVETGTIDPAADEEHMEHYRAIKFCGEWFMRTGNPRLHICTAAVISSSISKLVPPRFTLQG